MFRVSGFPICASLVFSSTLLAAMEPGQRFSNTRPPDKLSSPDIGSAPLYLDSSSTNDVASDLKTDKPQTAPLANINTERISQLCNSGELADQDCKAHWTPILRESLEWLAIQHGGNWGMDQWMRYDTFKQPYWKGYTNALKN